MNSNPNSLPKRRFPPKKYNHIKVFLHFKIFHIIRVYWIQLTILLWEQLRYRYDLPNKIIYRICNNISNTTSVDKGLLTLPAHLRSPPVFALVRVAYSLVSYVCLLYYNLYVCIFWLSLWYLSSLLNKPLNTNKQILTIAFVYFFFDTVSFTMTKIVLLVYIAFNTTTLPRKTFTETINRTSNVSNCYWFRFTFEQTYLCWPIASTEA